MAPGAHPARHDRATPVGSGGSQAATERRRLDMGLVQEHLDDIDRRIVSLLMEDGRMSFVDIGARVGLSAPAVKRRVDRLREAEVITGFTVTVRPDALGWRTEAYVEVYCDSAAPPGRLADVARNHPEVVRAVTVTVGPDALLHIRAADM